MVFPSFWSENCWGVAAIKLTFCSCNPLTFNLLTIQKKKKQPLRLHGPLLGAAPNPGAKLGRAASGRASGIKTCQIYVKTMIRCGDPGPEISQKNKKKTKNFWLLHWCTLIKALIKDTYVLIKYIWNYFKGFIKAQLQIQVALDFINHNNIHFSTTCI